jgi:hypothetical protein
MKLSHPDVDAAHLRDNDARIPHVLETGFLYVPDGLGDRDRFTLLSGLKLCEGLKPFNRIRILNGNHAIKNVWL